MLKLSALALAALTALSLHGVSVQAQGLATTAAPAAATLAAPTFDRSGEDPAVRPQDDLFRAANGGWLARTPIPADKSGYGNFHVISDMADSRVKAIVEELAKGNHPAGSTEQKIGDFYRAYLDEARLDALGLAPLQPELDRLAALKDARAVAAAFGRLQGLAGSPLALNVDPDQKDPKTYLTLAYQSGLGLGNRDYYLKSDERMAKARVAYVAYLTTLFTLQGDSAAAAHAAEVMALETRIAQAQWSEVANRDPQKTWNPMSLKKLSALAPGMDWKAFFDAAAMPGLNRVNMVQPSYARALAKLVKTTPVATWRLYLQAQLMSARAPTLGKAWRDASFAFHGTALAGQKEQKPRWQQATDALDGALGEAVGKVYVARHFPAANKQRMQLMVDNLMVAFGRSIDGLTWMSPVTKAKARDKLSKYTTKIGYPDQWRDYAKLEIREGDALGNAMRSGRFEFERAAAKLGQPVDRHEWLLTPQTVNAYYNPSMNEIVFPAAILEAPFFDMKADDAVNYGAIGAVIGHEISHGFDDQGAQYDGDGRLSNWWTKADSQAFAKLGAQLVAQYSAYEALPGHKVNGELTLGENIADLSGLQIAYKAWQVSLGGKPAPEINGLTGEQRFFYGFAQAWRGKRRDELTLRLLTADPHSPEEFRANGTVINHDGFHQAFGTRKGDGLYKASEQRLRIW
ncbi:M13 family metallopeptidase [Ideonella sp.]|uniref:M13 family metallopeptidase n=1 Tax=Ideonella sp. TaxID=1929293 RepID=UPI003BB7CF63